jgi:DNA-binding Lrp family transcriptional regulator
MSFGTTIFTTIQDRHVSPSEIGRKIGMNEKTVRVRVAKMEEVGFINYYQVVPNLSFFGLKEIGYYRVEALNLPTKYKLIERTQEMQFVVEVVDYVGRTASLAIAGSSRDEIQLLADRIASEFELRSRLSHRRHIAECSQRLDYLDWKIIKELRYSARRSASDLAKSLSITPRMAEYRIKRLLDSGAMLVRAAIDPRKQTGLVFFDLELSVDELHHSSVADELAKRYPDQLWSTLSSKGVLIASMFGFSIGEAEDIAIASGKIPGVRSSVPYLLKEMIEPRGPNWIDKMIDKNLG